jgi:3-oxoacyl-[acyl-carrier protein] reductase
LPARSSVNRGWDDATPEDWLEHYASNVAAVVRCIQGFLPAMRAAGWGWIIQLGTGEVINPFPVMPDYTASKAALVNLTVSLSKHLSRTGVTVNTVSPGIVHTDGVERFYRSQAAKQGWGTDWSKIESPVLAEVLDNPVGRLAPQGDRQPGRTIGQSHQKLRYCQCIRQASIDYSRRTFP